MEIELLLQEFAILVGRALARRWLRRVERAPLPKNDVCPEQCEVPEENEEDEIPTHPRFEGVRSVS